MKIRKGLSSEKEQFEAILIEAATRIKETGSSQWGHILKGEEGSIVAARLHQEEAYIYEEEVAGKTKIVAVFYLYERPNDWDYGIWQEEEQAGVFYLHRLSLADGYTGKGIAEQLLRQLQSELSVTGGRALRLDCIKTQPVLNQLYNRSGFTLVKEIPDLEAGPIIADFNLYECQLADLS